MSNQKEPNETFYLIERYRWIDDGEGDVWWDYYPRPRQRNTYEEALQFAEEQSEIFTSFIYECKKVAKISAK